MVGKELELALLPMRKLGVGNFLLFEHPTRYVKRHSWFLTHDAILPPYSYGRGSGIWAEFYWIKVASSDKELLYCYCLWFYGPYFWRHFKVVLFYLEYLIWFLRQLKVLLLFLSLETLMKNNVIKYFYYAYSDLFLLIMMLPIFYGVAYEYFAANILMLC